MKSILCIGSVTTDVIVSPADSIPTPGTLRAVDSVTVHVGGCAANASIDLGKLGVPVGLCCRVGEDNFGDFVCQTAQKAGVDTRYVARDAATPTTVSVVCVTSAGERSFLYNPGSAAAFVKEDVPQAAIDEYDILFVAGAMLLTSFDGAPCADILRRAQEQGKYTAMDTAWDFADVWLPKVRDALPYVDLFMPSYDEAARLTDETDPDAIADKLFAFGVRQVVIKLGRDGALVCPTKTERYRLPTYLDVRPVDTTGAGDSFAAGFLAGLAQDWDCRRAGAFANAVGTHCIGAIGASTGIPPMAQVLEFMNTHTPG